MGGWPEQIAEAARDGARQAISRGALEAADVPDRVYSATLAAALRVKEGFRAHVEEDKDGKVRRDGTATSKAAALKVAPRSGTQRRRVLDRLVAVGLRGATRDELAGRLGMSPNTVRPRLVELIEGGFAEVVPGSTRPSDQGDPAEVLVATEKARQLNGSVTRDSSPDLSQREPPAQLLGGHRPHSPYDPEVS